MIIYDFFIRLTGAKKIIKIIEQNKLEITSLDGCFIIYSKLLLFLIIIFRERTPKLRSVDNCVQ